MIIVDPGQPLEIKIREVYCNWELMYLPNATRADLCRVLGPPMVTAEQDQVGMADYWAYEFRCGLKLYYWCLHDRPGAGVDADVPELQHIRRHLALTPDDWLTVDGEAKIRIDYLSAKSPERADEYHSLNAFQVWRQDDNANVDRVLEPTSERDAKCLVEFLESTGHKQTYWYERV